MNPVDYRQRSEQRTKQWSLWLGLAAAVAVIAAVVYFQREPAKQPPEVESPVLLPAQPPAVPFGGKPEVHFPIPETPAQPIAEPPLPLLNESDGAIQESLARLFGQESLSQFLIPEGIIRRIVATIDNLPREKVAGRVRPLSPIAGKFLTTGPEGDFTLNPANYARYATFVRLVSAADAGQIAAVYLHFYPLFQAAYEELGYPNRYFNDRLIEVIDHLLATPDVRDPIKLVRPGVFYRFADPDLESRSAGQKALIRIGRDNAVIVKAKLYEIRQAVTGKTTKQ